MAEPVARDVTALPPELQIVGAQIHVVHAGYPGHDCPGRVIAVEGPYPPDPDFERWYGRPDMGGYTIVYEDTRPEITGPRKRWINEVFVEDGRIFAHPRRDEIVVVEPARGQQLRLF